MVSTWYKLVLPRFKEKRHRSLLCCSRECQNIWKYANQQNPLLDSNYTIPPKCKRYFLFLKSSRRSPQFDTRFRFEVLFLLQMTFLKLFPSAELPRFSSPQSEDMWTRGKLAYKDWTGRGHPLDTFVQNHGKRERPGVNWPSQFWNLLNSTVSSFDLCACLLGRVWPVAIPSTAARQALLSMEFSRQEYWSGLPFPTPGYLPTQVSNSHVHLLHCRRILYHKHYQGSPPLTGGFLSFFWLKGLICAFNIFSKLH